MATTHERFGRSYARQLDVLGHVNAKDQDTDVLLLLRCRTSSALIGIEAIVNDVVPDAAQAKKKPPEGGPLIDTIAPGSPG